ncbi:GerMN domain-containing protein [Actinoplanes sp. NPDC051851]|uniref:GerMN domain-containing protein n=1 Tax=Actinoplanes sp. NPDC051851 TaxID=3154753 RepID=UPI003428EE28
MKRLLALSAALFLPAALFLSACGVSVQGEPHEVELPRRPLTAQSATAFGSGEVAEVLCLIRDGKLAQTVRRVSGMPTAQQQLGELVSGPTPVEQNAGLSTALAGMSLEVTTPTVTAVVEVTEADSGSGRNDEVLGYGQIVCTLTSRADIGSVSFTQSGKSLRVPRGDGSLSDAPLTAGDYRALLAP